MKTWFELYKNGRVFHDAFIEQQCAIRDVYQIADELLSVPSQTPSEYDVRMKPVPEPFYTLRKNIFSTLFQSMYHLMGCDPRYRMFYGKLIHLFRIWVTSADNLLDEEDKVVIPIQINGSSRTMRQVISIMTGDRILQRLLVQEIRNQTITDRQAQEFSERSLQILLPSAAQEAGEEEGITDRPDPEYVLNVIHHYKTGILFNVAFLGPEIIEPHLNTLRTAELKKALLNFGIGCQLLDDVRDMARDCCEKRHNYLLSVLHKDRPELLRDIESRKISPDARLYLEVPDIAASVAQQGLAMMKNGLTSLGETGLNIRPKQVENLAKAMFRVLDLQDLTYA